jgi:hypothetical protein
MARIWTPENRFQKWLDVEIAACEAWARQGRIPVSSLGNITRRARFDISRIEEIEKEVKHDVIAFLTSVAESVGADSRYIHMGLTSSDVLDTSFAVLLKEAAVLIINDIKGLLPVLRNKALEYKDTVMMGRSHGVHAEPTTFGLKLALWYAEMCRNLERMERAADVISYGKLSGAVGTYSSVTPSVERYVLKRLGLKPEPVSTQVVQRDRHAEYFTTLAIVAASIEKFAVEIRHLQRTEVREVEEPFTEGQKSRETLVPFGSMTFFAYHSMALSRPMSSKTTGYRPAVMERVVFMVSSRRERTLLLSSPAPPLFICPARTIFIAARFCPIPSWRISEKRFLSLSSSLVISTMSLWSSVFVRSSSSVFSRSQLSALFCSVTSSMSVRTLSSSPS